MATKKDFTEEKLEGKPTCFTRIQWVKWKAKPRLEPNRIDGACIDCSPEFKKRMMAEGKCDWPDVEFFLMEDGTMEGRRTSITDKRPRQDKDPGVPITSLPRCEWDASAPRNHPSDE